jgi:putative ABC transport system permease protein
MDMIFDIPGRERPAGRQVIGDVQWRFVSAHYFDVLQIRATFRPAIARPGTEPNRGHQPDHGAQILARHESIGQTIFIGPGLGPAYQVGVTEIVGVVGDVRECLNIDPQPVMYQLPAQLPDADIALLNGYQSGAILIRTRPGAGPMTVSQAVENALLAGEQLPTTKVRTMERASPDSTERQEFNLLLLGLIAAIAVSLAALGIEQRTHEIGVRAALGARVATR